MSNYYAPYYDPYQHYAQPVTYYPQGYGTSGVPYGASSYGYSAQYGYAPQLPSVSLPRISYNERSLSDMLAEARNIIEPQYSTQLRQAGDAYEDTRSSLASQYVNQRSGIEQSATDRGFGRSSYVVDALAQSQGYEKDDSLKLDKQYGNTVAGITDAREQAIAGYADQLRREQAQLKLQVDQYNQQIAQREAELNQTYRLKEYQTQIEALNRAYSQLSAPSAQSAPVQTSAASYSLPTYEIPKAASGSGSAAKSAASKASAASAATPASNLKAWIPPPVKSAAPLPKSSAQSTTFAKVYA